MTDEKDARLTRQLIREELDASNSYEEKAQATSDPEAAKVYRDISREEKVHAGELQALLDREDPESTEAMKEGIEETGLTGSFKDIFDRKREDYIHKSMYGVHFEKRLSAKEQKILDREAKDAKARAKASAEGEADAEKARQIAEQKQLELEKRKQALAEERRKKGITDEVEDDDPELDETASSLIDIISPEARSALAGGSHQSLVDSYKGEENPRIRRPKGRMRIPIDDLLKFREDGPERVNETGYGDADTGYIESDADRLYNIAMMQGAGEQEDGSVIPVSSKEFVKPKPRNKGLISDTQRNLSWGNDYDEIFDPDQIGDTEVERYVRERDFKDEGDAPSSATRPWLTWRYFGNHLLQATPIREEVRDEFGNPLTHPVRVPATKEEPVLDENGNEVGKRKVPIPGQFETVEEPITRIIMNYRISRVGKDTQYDWEPFIMKSLWDPTAFNPVTKKNTGAFIPEQITTPDGTVIYDINDPNRTKDPWTTMEEEMSKQALYGGVVAYITDPEYRAKVDKFTPKRASKGGPKWNTPFIDEVREMIMNADPSTFGADTGEERMKQVLQMMNTMSANDFDRVIAKVALQYKDMDAEFARAKEAAARHKSQLDSLIESAVSEKVSKHLNDWLTKNNVIGLDDGETVTADNIYRFYDSISGMYRFSIRGEKVEMPMEKLEAWMDHATRYYDQDARLRYNAALKEEAKVQEAFNERQNIEDKAISDYIYNAMRNELNEMGGKMEGFSVLALHEAADELTQELLYGDGTKFQEFMSVMGDIEAPSGDPRSILLQKAGFNWDVFENNRKLLRQSADMALTAEVSSMKDPKFHLQVAEDLKAAFIKRKNGIAGVLAVAAANKEASRRMANDPDWLWEHSLQSYLNKMTRNGNEVNVFDGKGNVIARARDVFDATEDRGDKLMEHLRNGWIAKGPDDVKPTEGGGWDNYFDEKMGEHVPNMLDQVISNVGNAIRGNSEFKESLFKGKFSSKYGGDTMRALVDYLSDPNADTGTLKARIMNGDTKTLKALMNINGKARLGGVYKERGLKGDEGGTMDLSQAREDLGRMIYASMTPGGARDQFATTMRNVARSTIQKILDNDLDDPELKGFTERLVKGAYETTLNNLVRMAALNSAQIRVEKAHAIVKPKLKRPTPGEEDYATKKAEYDAAWKEYGDSTATRTQEIYEMRDKLLLDPEFVAKHRQVFENLAKEKTADTIARDRHLRDKFSKALGQSSRIMSLTGFQNLGEGTMWEGDNERSSLDGMVELTDREKMDKLIADYKGDLGMTRDEIRDQLHDVLVYETDIEDIQKAFRAISEKVWDSGDQELMRGWVELLNECNEALTNGIDISEKAFNRLVDDSEFMQVMKDTDYTALTKMYMARGYPADQAEERARQYIELHDVSSQVPERDSPDAIVSEYTADTQVHPDDLSEADTTKLVLGAMKNYFEKELRPTITDPKDLEALENGGREGKMVIFKYLADKGLAKPIYDNPADKENKEPTGYSVNWDAFSEPDVESKWTGPANIKGDVPTGLGTQRTVDRNENALGKRILSDYIGSNFSLGSAQKLYPKYADSTREHGIRAYETTLEKLARNRMVDNLANQLKMEGRNPRKAKSLAKRMVSDRFDQTRISSKNLAEQGTPFAEDLEEFGITPETVQELKVEAMRASNAPYYTKFIKPFFERSGRKVGPSTAADELKLFEQLNSGDPEAQNHPEFKEYWDQFMNTPGLMHPNLASRLVGRLGDTIRRGRKGLKSDQKAQDDAVKRTYSDQKESQDVYDLIDSALRDTAINNGYDSSGDWRKDYEDMLSGKRPVEPDFFRAHLRGLLDYDAFRPKGVSNLDAYERELFARIVNDPETKINFKGMETIQNRVRNKHKREQETLEKREKKDRELKALQAKFGEEAGEKAYLKAHLDELLKDEEEIQERHRIGTESEKKIHAERLKAQGGPRSPPREEGDIKPPKQEDVTNLSSVLKDSLNIFARATPKPIPEKMKTIPEATVASDVHSPTADYLDAKNKVDSQGDGLGGGRTTSDDVKQTDFTVPKEAKDEYKANLDAANKDLQKKQASAFDTPFADILSTKRTQAIRKTETGTVISPEGVSTPMTEQTSAPQEQNSVETGGFAELMKSKMASTHMMEEPSEEREDWIPMRNGYRRVTIGSGKDCVRSMMRNPPRSANAPGTRTRKV